MKRKKINYLEIIELRSNNVDLKILNDKLIEFKDELNNKNEDYTIKLYRNSNINTDWSFILSFESEIGIISPSKLGLRIASVLHEFGMVHHNVWSEEKEEKKRRK